MLDQIDTLDESSADIHEALKEVDYLNSIPGLIASIHEVMELDDTDFSEEIEW